MSQKARYVIPTKIGDQYTQERLTSTKKREYIKARVFKDFITSNGYKDSIIFDARLLKDVLFHLKNLDAANTLSFKILACGEPDVWEVIKAETDLAAATSTYETSTEPWAFVKIQVKSKVAGTPAKITAYIGGQH